MHDLKQLRAAAERTRGVCAVWNANETYGLTESEWKDFQVVRDAFLALTDPTPLTVERLVEAGFVYNTVANTAYFGGLCVLLDSWTWFINSQPLQFAPRTVGELAMLKLLMEGR